MLQCTAHRTVTVLCNDELCSYSMSDLLSSLLSRGFMLFCLERVRKFAEFS